MTGREVEVLMYIAQGHTCGDVAEFLYVSKRTVDFHLGNVYEKLRVKNRVQAILAGGRLGLIPADFPNSSAPMLRDEMQRQYAVAD